MFEKAKFLLMNNKNLASDLFLHKEIQTFENLISHYRFQLTDAEIERYRKLGKDAGEASESNSEARAATFLKCNFVSLCLREFGFAPRHLNR